jgi:exosome complex exonuclease DIS3/RRP44
VQDEQGYVLYVRKNALQILIPKYGLEGTLYVSPPKGEKLNVTFVYNEEVLFHIHTHPHTLRQNNLIGIVTGCRVDD